MADEPSLDELAVSWRTAFRAARTAIDASRLPPARRSELAHRLSLEVADTQRRLKALAGGGAAASFLPLIVSPVEARRLLGLPPEVTGCVFNLDGVLVPSAALHVAAWMETFDEFLHERGERTRGRFRPFNPRVDYPQHLHARPRLDGVRAFLESRGIRLPEGDASDVPGAETVHGLAMRKTEALYRLLEERGLQAFEGSRSYLALAHEAGIRCAVVSASATTQTVLDRAGLTELVDERVDGIAIRRQRLRVKPAPDTLLEACRRLGVEPRQAAAFETTRAGVAAGRTAGFDLIVGVDGATGADRGDLLRAEGADLVVAEVGDLFEQRLAA